MNPTIMHTPLPHKTLSSFLIALIFSAVFAATFYPENTHAESTGKCKCDQGSTWKNIFSGSKKGYTREQCEAECKAEGKAYYFQPDDGGVFDGRSTYKDKDVCDGFTKSTISSGLVITAFKCLLLWILRFVGWLLNLAVTLMQWVVSTEAMNDVLKNNAVYTVWKMVRDLLNIAFIMTLLFSAFATILQIEKYNYKRILLNLVIMALLVNFSYPITLFIIDVSNVIMYYFLNNLLGNGTGGIPNILEGSKLGEIIMGTKLSDDALKIISAIVFTFIMTFTVLAIGIMLLIRLVALAILLIFSSVAYVGSVIPGTKLASAASGWWSNLMEQAFFGPIMVFMIYVAAKLLIEMNGNKAVNNIKVKALVTSGDSAAENVANAVFFLIPIAILWMGLMSAKKSSAAGAGVILAGAMKAKAWGTGISTGIAKSPYKGAGWVAKQTGVTDSLKNRAENFKKQGFLGSKAIEQRAAKRDAFLGGFGWGDKNAMRDLDRKRASEKRKEWKENGGASDEDIQKALSGSLADKKAAALEMAENKGFKDLSQYRQGLDAAAKDPVYQQLFNKKVEEKHIRFVIENEGNTPAAFDKHLKGMTSEALAKQKGLHENINEASGAGFKDYVNREIKTDTEYHKELFKKLSREQRAKYGAAGFDPTGSSRPSGSAGGTP